MTRESIQELIDLIDVTSATAELIESAGSSLECKLALLTLYSLSNKEIAKGSRKADITKILQMHKDICAIREHLGLEPL